MACKTSFELYHNFPKLAEETGFTFNTHRPRVHIEWNKIRLVDIESLIRERKFVLIEQHLNDILDCVLESEFDVRILDEGVLKIFRLAQLAVEYQQFCRHYLDRSVYVLREEVTALAQELDSTKRLLRERDEEIRKLRRKSRHSFRNPLPYGNDNIATMILKTLNNKNDLFPTLTSAETLRHNKCTYCDKVFLNQLYLESHMSRRHANVTEIPQKDVDTSQFERSHDENNKLTSEITELRAKLADMEKLITNFRDTKTPAIETNENKKGINEPTVTKEMKDVEVSTNGEGYILDKIEEWKREEHEKYNKEINLLRTQIIAMIDSCKEKDKPSPAKDDSNVISELNATIKQQGEEILALKRELTNSKSNPNVEEIEQRKKMEAQMAYWVKRAELQSSEYKLLLQKLDEVGKDAERSRAQADAEKLRVTQLQALLQQKNTKSDNGYTTNIHDVVEPKVTESPEQTAQKPNPKTNLIRDRSLSLQRLQRKAQELLNIENTSTSESSASSEEKVTNTDKIKMVQGKDIYEKSLKPSPMKKEYRKKKSTKKDLQNFDENHSDSRKSKNANVGNGKTKASSRKGSQAVKENGAILHPGSPMKIIRAKITEEVNNRLVTLGVDPLKRRLPQNIFNTQRMQLQEHQEIKFKKYPRTEQVLHSLLARLDSKATKLKQDAGQPDLEYISPSKNSKAFSLSSVISNVKTKALSLVKANDSNKNSNKSYDTVAKKAMLLLKTPPSSTHSSPKKQDQNSPVKSAESHNPKAEGIKIKTKDRNVIENFQVKSKSNESDTESILSDNEYYVENNKRISTSIEKLVKSPTRRPLDKTTSNESINVDEKYVITATSEVLPDGVKKNSSIRYQTENNQQSSDDVESLVDHTPRRAFSVDNILKQTKGVLKNASSTSSLNKKKVIFDMDAIQMKSVSASSPSQSVTEKSDNNEKYGLGLVKLDNEEWDISSIENEPIQKNPVMSRTSPKIAELKQTIESQLARRNTMSTALVGGVDVVTGMALNNPAVGGSNTSLGSSILDDTDSTPAQNQVAFVKPRSFVEKDDSEIDISEFMTDELHAKNTIKTK
ncbi:uncharacterized protein [Epargyreus clarus]|uniref:uncharacterized protein n=1 Tax=Epargyreus clarus TaxID=520877 RepID=UPI003C2F0618